MNKLSPETRLAIVDHYVDWNTEGAHDWDSLDIEDILRNGHKGWNECTDLELVDNLVKDVKDCYCPACDTRRPNTEIEDPQLRAMWNLHAVVSQEEQKAEIMTYIKSREQELATRGLAPTPAEPEQPAPCKLKTLLESAKRELGL